VEEEEDALDTEDEETKDPNQPMGTYPRIVFMKLKVWIWKAPTSIASSTVPVPEHRQIRVPHPSKASGSTP
jgi:hypothetical protein